MSNDGRWQLRIQHILDAIERIQRYTIDLTEDTFPEKEMAFDAVIRNFQVIGEAARKMPKEVQVRYALMPWSLMQGMRHVLVHDYHRIDGGIVWRAIQKDLPALIEPLRNILRENPIPQDQ